MKFFLQWIVLSVLSFFHCQSPVDRGFANCQSIDALPGPEDFVIDRETGWMYISSHDRRNPNDTGQVFSYNTANGQIQKIQSNLPPEFRPHGLSLAKMGKEKRLFVISHRGEKQEFPHSIEVFLVDKGNLKWEKSLVDSKLISPNDLYVLENGKIFISNDFGSESKMKNFWDLIWKRNTSPISFYDGNSWTFLEPKIAVGNGIHYVNRNGKEYIYRSSILDNLVVKYELQWKDEFPVLDQGKILDLKSSADNFELDSEGNLILAGHPSHYKFLRHASSNQNISPTQVFRINSDDSWEEIYFNSGREISAGSTAAIYKDRIYIGQVFEPFILNCEYKK